MIIEDVIQLNFCYGMGEEELLVKRVVFVNIDSTLSFDIKLATINGIGNSISQMFQLTHPGQWISTEIESMKFPDTQQTVLLCFKGVNKFSQ